MIKLTFLNIGLYSIPLGIILSVLCMDVSLGNNLEFGFNTLFQDIQFNEDLNYTVHYLNLAPLMISFQVLSD